MFFDASPDTHTSKAACSRDSIFLKRRRLVVHPKEENPLKKQLSLLLRGRITANDAELFVKRGEKTQSPDRRVGFQKGLNTQIGCLDTFIIEK